MARTQSIIVGGGIAATAPFSTGNIPVFVSVSPPAVSNSIMGQVLVGNLAIINVALGDPNAAATEDFKWRGGMISEQVGSTDSTVLGRNASAPGGSGAMALGLNSVVNSAGNVAVGPGASALSSGCVAFGSTASSSGNSSTAIGQGSIANGGGGGGGSVAVGAGANAGTASICIGGNGASASVASTVTIGVAATAAVGSANVCIGQGASVDSAGTHSTIVGQGSRATTGQGGVAIGCEAEAREQGSIAIGGHVGGVTLTQVNTVRSIGIGSDLTISAGHTENIAIGSGLRSFAANVAMIGGPNTIINTLVVGRGDTHTAAVNVTVRCTNVVTTADTAGGNLTVIAPRGTGNAAAGGEIIFQTGAPGASGAALQAATSQFKILKSAGGAGVPGVEFMNVTNGAGAAAGTLLNAPTAGDPTFWLPISITGVGVRFIPCWT